MARARDLYDVLGVRRDASQDEVRKAFRRLAREFHPDVSTDPEAEHRFKEINLAYETLSDPTKRRQYDLFGGEGLTPDMFTFMGDVSGIFEAFFGAPFARTRAARSPAARRGADLRALLDLTFEEAAFGTAKEVEVERAESCGRCEGSGSEPGTFPSRCSRCGGSGQVSDVRRSVFGTVMTSRTCGACGGAGRVIASPCTGCGGAGRVRRAAGVRLEVPPGVADGMELRVEGGGDGGARGGAAGDLHVTLRVAPHPLFERRGSDLVCTLEVPLTQALLGADVEIPTLDGPETVRIAPGTRPGAVLRLRGLGLPHLGRRGRGELFVEVDVAVPEGLSRKERALVEQLADLREERPGKPVPGRLRPRGS